MARYYILTLCAFAFNCSSIFSQNQAIITTLDQPVLSKVQSNAESEEINWQEDLSARTVYTATFYGDNGEVKMNNSSVPIHYFDENGSLRSINPVPQQLDNGDYAALEQAHPTYLHLDGSFSLSLNQDQYLHFENVSMANGKNLNSAFMKSGDEFINEANEDGISKQILFRENGFKYNYILSQTLNNTEPLVFVERIILPAGYFIEPDFSRGKETELGWSGLLLVKDTKGEIVSTLHEALCFDQNRSTHVASYRVERIDNAYLLKTIISEDWLNSQERSYPIIVDPIVTGPMASWTGGYIPSCFMPTYSQDSILVTIPANITVTELNVTASYYADPFTSAVMSDGSMYFSTNCANSQIFTITGATGQSPGTAYLDYYNLLSPITCCFPESCSQQTFWLSYHLGRSANGSGCNINYIRYDPTTTSWPFQATVIGHTAEPASAGWNVSGAPICSDKCTLSGTAYMQYGVAPYTVSHPWSQDTVVIGTNVGCGSGYTVQSISMTIPNCPVYCDTLSTTLSVPPPVIYDACGNLVAASAAEIVPLKPTPGFNPVYDPVVCSGEAFVIDLDQCLPGAFTTWMGNGTQGWQDQIAHSLNNTSGSVDTMTYLAYTSLDGCDSDTISVSVVVYPNPVALYQSNPNPVISGVPANFTDMSSFPVSPGISWYYFFGDGGDDTNPNPIHLYNSPGMYPLCLYVENEVGCVDSLCELLAVAPAEIQIPNVVTANGDGTNDLLEFMYLDFYPSNHLTVTNRWGDILHDVDDYKNDWSPPSEQAEGVYFFVLDIIDTDQQYSGFFHLLR